MMWERYTERARQAVEDGKTAALDLRHGYYGTEHLLIGLTTDSTTLAAQTLAALLIDRPRVVAAVERIVGVGGEPAMEPLPFTSRAKKALELSLREALALGHNYIGTEHVLLGLVRVNEGIAARILLDFDVDSSKIREQVIREINRARSQKAADHA